MLDILVNVADFLHWDFIISYREVYVDRSASLVELSHSETAEHV